MNLTAEEPPSLSSAWGQFEYLNTQLVQYLNTSEQEFANLIEALDACWNMTENVQKATARLGEFTDEAMSNQTAIIREALLDACGVFKNFLVQIQEVRCQLARTTQQTGELLVTAEQLQKSISPLKHIAFHFLLEASRLPPREAASVIKAHDGMKEVVEFVKQAGDSQQSALLTILDKLAAAAQSVEETCISYALHAAESEQKVVQNLDLLSTVPRDLQRVQSQANAVGTILSNSIRDAVKALQGHDAIRQRLEHILGSLASLRDDSDQVQQEEPAHTLLLQREQTRSVLELVVNTGNRIERELNSVIGCAQGIAGGGATESSADQVQKFEEVVDRLDTLSAEVAGLLSGEAKTGNFVITQIDPIWQMLSSNSRELERVSDSMKRLALNVLIDADKIPSARGLRVLGVWTSNAADNVLNLARDQNKQFVQLGAALQSQIGTIAANVERVESCQGVSTALKATDSLRKARRTEYDAVSRVCQEASQLREKTESLVQSLKFVDEARRLLTDLDITINLLLTLYPKSDKPFDLEAASAGYTMQEQHDTHAMVFGGAAGSIAPPKAGEGQELGGNVELF